MLLLPALISLVRACRRSRALLCFTLLLAQPAGANCEITRISQTEDDRAAKIPFGRINLSHPAFHPDGTLLASVMVPPTQYTFGGAKASSVLWKCDKQDVDNGMVYFLVATNGDSRFGGEFEIGPAGSGIYGTWFDHIGLRQTMAGITLSRHWRKVPLQSWLPVKERVGGKLKERVHIRLVDIPPLQAELYWVEQHVPESGWYNCSGYPTAPSNSVHGISYDCIQPASYIQLVGPGPEIPHDEVGEDHGDYHWDFWGADNGFGYTLWRGGTLSANPTCVVHNATPQVQFATASVQDLQNGGEVPANFSIVLDCNSATVSGSGSGETAIGLQVSEGAFAAAQRMGFVRDGGVDFLLSDQYNSDSSLAKGVGIALYDADGNQRRFVGWPGTVGKGHPRGPLAGWHPVLWGARMTGLAPPDNYHLQLDFTARLKQLPGQTATPGKVRATAHVLVKVQ